ncbi:hypothetical protein Tco_1231728, partial [Tanacetum coccineum]
MWDEVGGVWKERQRKEKRKKEAKEGREKERRRRNEERRRCLHDRAYQRPTMVDVVAALESILATQEKSNRKCIESMKNKIFGSTK